MIKRLMIVLIFAFVVGIAFTAYAEVQNVKVSGDITMTGIRRDRLTLKKDETVSDYGNVVQGILSQVRVRVDADLTDNVSTVVRLINERMWGMESTSNSSDDNDTTVDVDLAYVTLKEFLYSPLTLTVGRQELRYGNALVIGDIDTNGVSARNLSAPLEDLSLRKSFDAVRAILNYDPLVVDLVYSRVIETALNTSSNVELYGVNAAYAVNKNLNTEVYMWERKRGKGYLAKLTKPENLITTGAKGMYTGIENMVLGAEAALQFGDRATSLGGAAAGLVYPNDPAITSGNLVHNRSVTAYAIQLVAQYMMPKVKHTPMLRATYTNLSGEKFNNDKKTHKGWDPMYEDQARGTLFNKVFGFSNAQLFNVTGSMKPMDDVTATLDYYYIQLNKNFPAGASSVHLDGVYNGPTYTMTASKNFGNEVDLGLTYDYTEDVQLALSAGVFVPGKAFDKANRNAATQVIGSMKVTF
ncbi:MAG: hypothetical protein A2166_00575 [Omnitrophica WOR_2 bacterium RBG_13_41_10]|nr:MAG: hypothetical protein A2166_00575 [Omnitrophica WOR_2 bacterium RBG_13_41_10]